MAPVRPPVKTAAMEAPCPVTRRPRATALRPDRLLPDRRLPGRARVASASGQARPSPPPAPVSSRARPYRRPVGLRPPAPPRTQVIAALAVRVSRKDPGRARSGRVGYPFVRRAPCCRAGCRRASRPVRSPRPALARVCLRPTGRRVSRRARLALLATRSPAIRKRRGPPRPSARPSPVARAFRNRRPARAVTRHRAVRPLRPSGRLPAGQAVHRVRKWAVPRAFLVRRLRSARAARVRLRPDRCPAQPTPVWAAQAAAAWVVLASAALARVLAARALAALAGTAPAAVARASAARARVALAWVIRALAVLPEAVLAGAVLVPVVRASVVLVVRVGVVLVPVVRASVVSVVRVQAAPVPAAPLVRVVRAWALLVWAVRARVGLVRVDPLVRA